MLNVWLGSLAALLNLNVRYEEPSVLLQSGETFLLTWKECPPQCGYNNFGVKERGSHGYFMIATCCEPSTLVIRPGSQTYVLYPKKTRGNLARLQYLQEIRILPNSVFGGQGYLQHAGPG